MKKILLITAMAFLCSCTSGPVGNANVPQPSRSVDLDRYLGKWYEISRYENRFERDCEAVTAEYSKREDGLVGIVNSCHKGSVDGVFDVAEGKAKIVEDSAGAKLKVSFFGPFYVGDYWVLDHAQDYSWSIVGEPSGRYLWLLARAPHVSEKQMLAFKNRAKQLGYDVRLLRDTAQP